MYEYQRVECAFTSPVRTECGIFVKGCMQCCMSVSAVLYARVSCLVQPSGSVCFRGELGFLNCYDMCMCAVHMGAHVVFDDVYVKCVCVWLGAVWEVSG